MQVWNKAGSLRVRVRGCRNVTPRVPALGNVGGPPEREGNQAKKPPSSVATRPPAALPPLPSSRLLTRSAPPFQALVHLCSVSRRGGHSTAGQGCSAPMPGWIRPPGPHVRTPGDVRSPSHTGSQSLAGPPRPLALLSPHLPLSTPQPVHGRRCVERACFLHHAPVQRQGLSATPRRGGRARLRPGPVRRTP